MRRAIAQRLTESVTTIPQFRVSADLRVDALMDLRRTINESSPRRVSVGDLVVKAVALTLKEVPEANVIWLGDAVRHFDSADIAVAVATDQGLVAPVVAGADRLSLTEISVATADLAERARAGRLRQDELDGGSFTVSNLGMFAAQAFDAIINPPNSAILAVGAIRRAPIVAADGGITAGQVLSATLTADHRVIDGALAAQFMAAFTHRIENPITILI
jgi:pyruvate dehydrogenase E2 component (dihydrolipoamide acetyltransferase)